MTFIVVMATGVILVAIVHLVAGWIISNGLRKGALAVQPRGKHLEVRVREISADRIVLEAPGPRQDVGHPGTLGLVWSGGRGRLGDVEAVSNMRFTRRFRLIEGTPPVCSGDLADCPPVEIDPYVLGSDPGDLGLGFETISYDSPLGPMGAWLIPGERPDRWAVLCHGWTAERREMLRMLPAFHAAGFNALVIDYRNDPGAPQDASGRYRFGLSEWEDLEAAVALALARGAVEVVLGGCSTGGALVMAFLERSPLADSVSGVLLDAPNIILADAIRHGTSHVRATPLMIEFGMWVADLRWKVGWSATNYVQRADQTLRVPTLVFHGTSDQTIPISVSRQLEAKVPDHVELVETQAAGHVMSWNANPERYERYLKSFLERI